MKVYYTVAVSNCTCSHAPGCDFAVDYQVLVIHGLQPLPTGRWRWFYQEQAVSWLFEVPSAGTVLLGAAQSDIVDIDATERLTSKPAA